MDEKLELIKIVIRSILVSNAYKNSTVDELSKEYFKIEGKGIPFRSFGYTNIYDFLKSMPDVVQFISKCLIRGIPTEKTDHIEKMVINQKVPRNRSKNRRSSYYYNGRNQQPQPNQLIPFGHPQYTNVKQYNRPPPPVHHQEQFRWYAKNNLPRNQQSNYNSNKSAIPNEKIPKPEIEAKKDEEKMLKKVAFGETSIIEEKEENDIVSNADSCDLIDLDKSPIVVGGFDEECFDVNDLNSIDLNASILDTAVSEMEACLPRPLMDSLAYLKIEDDADRTEGSNNPLKALDNDPLSWMLLDYQVIYSAGVRIPDDDLILANDKILRIFVTQTFSPSRFWFNNGDLCHELDKLMAEIEMFYSELGPNELRIPENKMEPGLTCTAIYGRIFHRAEIISPPHNGKVRIYYVDFGTNELVAVDGIKYLVHDFANLPRQALRGCCDSIEPFDSEYWGWDAMNQFHLCVREKAVWAQIISYCPKDKVYRLAMIDNNVFNETHINKMMIIKKYAKLVERKMWIHDNCLESVGPFCYHHPSFDTLEKTDYPGYYERGAFYIKEGVEYYLLEELYNLFTINPNIARNKKYSYLMTKEHIPLIWRFRKFLGMPSLTAVAEN